jgi:hypothetical protein
MVASHCRPTMLLYGPILSRESHYINQNFVTMLTKYIGTAHKNK